MSTIIRISAKFCSIEGEENMAFLQALDRELSFNIQGAEYSPAYKYGKWDGQEHLLSKQLIFPKGLIWRVKEFYDRFGEPYQIIDDRPEKSLSAKIDIYKILKKLGKVPFPYQEDIVATTLKHDHGIIKSPTGSGKSLMAAMIVAQFGKKSIIFVIGRDLLYQTQGFFSQIFKQEIGFVGDGICKIHDITVASIWTCSQALGLKKIKRDSEFEEGEEKNLDPQKYQDIREMLKNAKLVIFDECHMAACSSIQEIVKVLNVEYLYGLSASPIRDDGADLLIEGVLGKKIVDLSASTLIDQGYLVQPTIKFIKVPPYHEKLKKNYQTIYKNYVVQNDVRNSLVVTGAQRLVEQNYQTLVLFNNVAHGEILYEQLKQKIPCILLSGKDSSDTRKAAREKLESGKVSCILASRIYDIGVDIPSLSGLVLAGAGKSSVRALQRIGRVIRNHKSKTRAAIIDFLDSAAFLKDHALARRAIYSTEERFNVIWPK